MTEQEVFDALARHVGAWYERAYGNRAPHEKMIELYSRGTARRVDLVFGPLKEPFTANPPKRVLDVGCGLGSIPVLLAARWPESHIQATDAVDTYYQAGMAAAAELGLRNIEFRTRPVEEINAQGEYDLIVSVNMLNFMTSHARVVDALSRMAAAARPGGWIAVYTPHRGSLREPFTRIPLLHHLPLALQSRIARKRGKRSTLSDVRNPSLREITTAMRRASCTPLGVVPGCMLRRAASTHIRLWFQKI